MNRHHFVLLIGLTSALTLSLPSFGMGKARPTSQSSCGYLTGRYLMKASALSQVCQNAHVPGQPVRHWPDMPVRVHPKDNTLYLWSPQLSGPAEIVLEIQQPSCDELIWHWTYRKEDPAYYSHTYVPVQLSTQRIEYGADGDTLSMTWLGQDPLATFRIRSHFDANMTGYPSCDRAPFGFNDRFKPRSYCPPRNEDIELTREPWGDLKAVFHYYEYSFGALPERTTRVVCTFPVLATP